MSVPTRQLNVKGLLVAVGLPVVLVGALVATLLGTGAFSRDNEGQDASMWLWTTPAGELARVNGLTAATDARFELTDAAGNPVQIEQTDTHLLLRNITTGEVSAVDLSTLALTGAAETAPGEGVRIALHDEGAFIIDQVQGEVSQVDPTSLERIGDTLSFPQGLTGGSFDGEGKLWIGVPREGTVVQIEPDEAGPEPLATKAIADPGQELSLTVLGDGVAVLNKTAQTMTTLRSDGRESKAEIELLGPAETAETSPGTVAAVTVTDPPSVVTVDDEATTSFDIAAGSSGLLGAAVEFHDRVYVPDGAAGLVWVYDLDGTELQRIEIDSAGGPIELYHSGDTLFANAVNTNNAVVVSSDGTAQIAEKSRDDILGGNVPPPGDTAESGDEGGDDSDDGSEGGDDGGEEEPPDPTPPGSVTALAGVGGDGLVSLSWNEARNNGSALTKYVIEGAGDTWEISPQQRTFEVDGLTNGQTYTFTVTAHNALGAGPTATSAPVAPTADVPDPVAAVDAVANPDGSVDLSWAAADGQGNTVTGYRIESVDSGGGSEVLAETAGTNHTFAPGELNAGDSYSFTVKTLAGEAASEPSPQSATVTPYTTPDVPGGLQVTTVKDQAGTVSASWSQPDHNGRAIEYYNVTANGRTQQVTGTEITLSGYGDGEQVDVSVTAVNEAGESNAATDAASTVAAPSITLEVTSINGEQARLNSPYDDGGGTVECDLETEYDDSGGGGMVYNAFLRKPCSAQYLNGKEGVTYTVTITIENVAGTDSASVTFTI